MSMKHYPPEFKQEAACLVLDQDDTIAEACEATGAKRTALRRWVDQIRHERKGETPLAAKAITSEHREIQALKEQVRRLQREKDILKNCPLFSPAP